MHTSDIAKYAIMQRKNKGKGLKFPEIHFGAWEHMLLQPDFFFFKYQKIPNKNVTLTPWHAMCAHQVSQRTDIFCGLCKEDENMSRR
jgi:hypothetical protein